MNLSFAGDLLQAFETGKVIEYLEHVEVGQLVHNPWLLGGIGALALLSAVMRWRLLLVTLFSISGFVGLVSYIQQRGTQLDALAPDTLLLFVGGGLLLIGIAIYFLFIRAE